VANSLKGVLKKKMIRPDTKAKETFRVKFDKLLLKLLLVSNKGLGKVRVRPENSFARSNK